MANKSAMPRSKAKTAYGLLSEIRKLILEEPKRYNQETWSTDRLAVPDGFMPACGTVCCVAGWVTELKRPYEAVEARGCHRADIAAEVLGLGISDAMKLFDYTAAGERRDKDQRVTQTTVNIHARRGAAHIARFQKKYAKQLKAKAV